MKNTLRAMKTKGRLGERETRRSLAIVALLFFTLSPFHPFTLSLHAQGLTLRDTCFLAAHGAPASGGGGGSAPPAPSAYFTFESLAGGSAVDDVAAHNLTGDGTTTTSVAGLIGNAYQLNGDFPFSADSFYDLAGMDFCIRLWVKYDVEESDYILDWPSDNMNLEIRRGYIDTGVVTFKLYSNTDSIEIDSDDTISTGGWHRIVVYYKNGVEVGLKLDNGTTKTSAYTTTIISSPSVYWELWSAATGYNRIDELAIWKSVIPSEAELTYDWNSGAGITYPW